MSIYKYLVDGIFANEEMIRKIQSKLPYMFQIAQIEASRAGKTGMEIGSVRERIIVALLIYKFGETNVETEIPVTEPEVDVKLFGEPISIKTITGKNLVGFKLIWTVDAQKAREFQANYYPSCDILLVHINWNGIGGFYYIPLATQKRVFDEMGRSSYIKLPKQGTNPRGVEITKHALLRLVEDSETRKIEINWHRAEMSFNPYKRWIDLWRED